jgi:hypothetical protein
MTYLEQEECDLLAEKLQDQIRQNAALHAQIVRLEAEVRLAKKRV